MGDDPPSGPDLPGDRGAGLLIPVLLIIGGTVFAAVAVGLSQQDMVAVELQRGLAEIPDMTPEEMEGLTALGTSRGALAVGAVLAIIGALITWVIQSGVYPVENLFVSFRGDFEVDYPYYYLGKFEVGGTDVFETGAAITEPGEYYGEPRWVRGCKKTLPNSWAAWGRSPISRSCPGTIIPAVDL